MPRDSQSSPDALRTIPDAPATEIVPRAVAAHAAGAAARSGERCERGELGAVSASASGSGSVGVTIDDSLAKVIPLDPSRMLGRVLAGRYRIEKLIAQGAMGRVYLATQLQLDRVAAVKVMSQPGDPRFAMRFCREASFASQLAHPNIVTVYDYGETERGELFMAMEYCAGRPLHEVLFEEAPFSADRVLNIAIQIARALRKAHSQGVVHRDLKPANVIVTPDEDGSDYVKVLDFGLVKPFSLEDEELAALYGEDNLTRPGNMVGTPEYVSPEQALGDHLDGRADIYSLGVMMFQMITGRLPFQGKNLIETVTQHFRSPIPRIADVAPEIDCPPQIEAIIRVALAKSRDDRFASMEEMLGALKSAWREVTDESFGTDAAFQAIVEHDTVADAAMNDAAAREVNHEPVCLEFADLELPQVARPDPSEVSSPSANSFEEERRVAKSEAPWSWLLWIVMIAVVVGIGTAAFLWAAQPEPRAPAPIVLPAPAPAPVVVMPVEERTIEKIAEPTIEPVKVKKKARKKKARSFKDNPY